MGWDVYLLHAQRLVRGGYLGYIYIHVCVCVCVCERVRVRSIYKCVCSTFLHSIDIPS